MARKLKAQLRQKTEKKDSPISFLRLKKLSELLFFFQDKRDDKSRTRDVKRLTF